MLLTNRIILGDNGVLSDLSINLNRPLSGTDTVVLVAAEDFIYIGADEPFNQRFFRVSTANSNASVVSVDLWAGTNDLWKAAVDVIDETASSGATLAQDGVISWKLDKDEKWRRQDTDKMTGSGLETLEIYDLFWARIKVSADLSAGTALQFVGYKFSNDEDLASFYPQFNTTDIKGQFESGKTDWVDQEIEAARIIIRDLKRDKEIFSQNQILDAEQFRHASVFKVAQIIATEFGNDFEDEREEAKRLYAQALDTIYRIDQNRNARLDIKENIPSFELIRN